MRTFFEMLIGITLTIISIVTLEISGVPKIIDEFIWWWIVVAIGVFWGIVVALISMYVNHLENKS
jgi:hypothetical protein